VALGHRHGRLERDGAMTTHHLDRGTIHREWNNALAPRLTIDPGDTVVFDTRDAADGYYSRKSTHADVLGRGPFRGHPLTGPVAVRGARPGDVLTVEIVGVKPAADFGWTAIRPGRGLMPEAEFPKPFLTIWDLTEATHARMGRDIRVPIAPFPGVMGVALDEPGGHSTMPPRKNGGNMDIKQLVAGTTLLLPVWVDDALFSVGDAHAAQGDGEVCVTAIEMMAQVTLRFGLEPGRGFREPRFKTRGPVPSALERGACYVTTANGPDLFANAQQAIRYMIEHLVEERGLSREEAYILCSVAVDLKISEIVDAPNWIVSAVLPETVFA
jgi:acetamidase/formamidase